MIEYITISQKPKNGAIQYSLSKNYGYIAIVNISVCGIQFDAERYDVLNVVVDEIDKTSDNPNRCISSLLLNDKNQYFYEREYNHIKWQKFDSSGKQLNISFYDEHYDLYNFHFRQMCFDEIQITLALLPENTKWIEKL